MVAGAGGKEVTARAGTQSRGTNQTGVRLYNERLVLSLIRLHRELPKADIARLTGLSPQTISIITNQLTADGLLLKGTPQRGRIGQPSVPYSLNPEGALAFGLKVGRRSVDLYLIDFTGRIIKAQNKKCAGGLRSWQHLYGQFCQHTERAVRPAYELGKIVSSDVLDDLPA